MPIKSGKPKINHRLRNERLSRHWSQQNLADQLDATVVSVKRWEHGITTPSPYFRLKLTTLFGKSEQELGLLEVETPASPNTDIKDVNNLLSISQNMDDASLGIIEHDNIPSDVEVSVIIGIEQDRESDAVVGDNDQIASGSSIWPKIISRRVAIFGLLAATVGISFGSEWLWKTRTVYNLSTVTHSLSPAITKLYTYSSHPPWHVNDVAWSPLGNFISCSIGDKTVQILDAVTGTVTLIYRGHTGYVNSAQWASDARSIASASADRTVQVWNPANGRNLLTYQGHTASVWYLAWSHDGMMIASGGRDSTVQVWDVVTGKQISIYRGHQGGIWGIRWSPDDSMIVSGGEDGILHVWSPTNAQPSQTFIYTGPHTSTINEVDWSYDGRQIASAHDSGIVFLWDVLTGGLMLTYKGHKAAVRTARWSPNGRWMASGSSDTTVQIWNALTGQQVLNYRGHSSDVLEVAWSPDGKYLASASLDLTMHVCRVQL